jgi:hypothetical protein
MDVGCWAPHPGWRHFIDTGWRVLVDQGEAWRRVEQLVEAEDWLTAALGREHRVDQLAAHPAPAGQLDAPGRVRR